MIGRSITPIVIDTDNALRTPRTWTEKFWGGDVDDAFAISFLIKSGISIDTIYSVSGNTNAQKAHENNLELLTLAGQQNKIPCWPGISELPLPKDKNSDFLGLGPLTNLAWLLNTIYKPQNVWLTLGRMSTRGQWPPYWPIEFNATFDKPALLKIFKSNLHLNIVPLDVAFKLQLRAQHLDQLQKSDIGNYLYKNSKRWLLRSLILKGRYRFPVWDLLSAVAITNPELCEIEDGEAYLFKSGLVFCDVPGSKKSHQNRDLAIVKKNIKVLANFDEVAVWKVFFKTINS